MPDPSCSCGIIPVTIISPAEHSALDGAVGAPRPTR
jgi:hypothetical protein